METIHLKSVDPVSQELLRSAARRGIKLNWERYEHQQPQDGFARLGLSCPVGCLQGPCRIDPGRRGAQKGICGLAGDGMAAAFLLRLAQQGLLSALAGRNRFLAPEIAWPAALAPLAASAVTALGGKPLFLSEVSETSALLTRPSEAPENLLKKALRLGLMAVALAGETMAPVPDHGLPFRVGYGLLGGGKINIGVAGNPQRDLILALVEKLKADAESPVQLLSLGDWIPLEGAYLPIVCTSGEAELAVSSGNISVVLAGPEAEPSLAELCRTLELPFLRASDTAGSTDEILKRAISSVSHGMTLDPALVAEAGVSGSPIEGLRGIEKLALIGGADDLRHSLGYLPVELAFALAGREFAVGAWGDAALWMTKNACAAPDRGKPALILDHDNGPLTVIAALEAEGRLGALGGVCFTGLKNCEELAFALGLAALGTKVCLAVPLPIWGSEPVRDLLREILAGQGGGLTHFDHPALLSELVSWFTGN